MKAANVFAPAKVNLTLHVTGRRRDGYHLLDSLVMFADVGDRIALRTAEQTTLEVAGPMAAGVPADRRNLVWQVADLFALPVAITLTKHLPAAAGIGGGSSDAAATALALAGMAGVRDLPAGLADLGADIRVCLLRRAARMQGIGERVSPVENLPPLAAVLANPGVEVATPEIFKTLKNKENPAMPARLPRGIDSAGLIDWLAGQRNDLEAPARALVPEIGETLTALRGLPGARLVRMSGSGATCFALFASTGEAEDAARALSRARPGWWVRACTLA